MDLTPRDGIVVDSDENPVEGAYVTVEWGTAPTPEITRVTGETGRFRLLLPRGRFRVAAKTPDGRGGVCEISGESEDALIRIELDQGT